MSDAMDAKLKRWGRLLEAYGSVRRRWPAAERANYDAMEAHEVNAKALADARALDALIRQSDRDASGTAPTDALIERIVAQLPHQRQQPRKRDAPFAAPASMAAKASRSAPVGIRTAVRDNIAAAGLLAASLVVGIFVGLTDVGVTTAATVSEVARITLDLPGTSLQTSALDDGLQLADDGDIL